MKSCDLWIYLPTIHCFDKFCLDSLLLNYFFYTFINIHNCGKNISVDLSEEILWFINLSTIHCCDKFWFGFIIVDPTLLYIHIIVRGKHISVDLSEEKLWFINLLVIHCCDKFCLDSHTIVDPILLYNTFIYLW